MQELSFLWVREGNGEGYGRTSENTQLFDNAMQRAVICDSGQTAQSQHRIYIGMIDHSIFRIDRQSTPGIGMYLACIRVVYGIDLIFDIALPFCRYVHPSLTVEGRYNIRKVFRVWTSLNKDEPEVTNIVFE